MLAHTKKQFVTETVWHQKQDNFIKATYGEGKIKACAVGCAIKSINKLLGTKLTKLTKKLNADIINVSN